MSLPTRIVLKLSVIFPPQCLPEIAYRGRRSIETDDVVDVSVQARIVKRSRAEQSEPCNTERLAEIRLPQPSEKYAVAAGVVAAHHALAPVEVKQLGVPATERTGFFEWRRRHLGQLGSQLF
jgi:hypothetical protein